MAVFGFLESLSATFGWLYFIAWSLSFYGQPSLNFGRRSTSGTTVDFPLINTLGFSAYFVSNVAFFYSPLIRAQYAHRNKGLTPTVQFNDITFAAHGLLLSVVTSSQYFFPRAWGFAPSAGSRPSRFILGISAGCVTGVAVILLAVAGAPDRDSTHDTPASAWLWLDVVYAVSYVKLVVTVIKYSPQVLVNYRNRSTKGWSISQILLDFVGGVLSLAQLAIDSYLQGDWSGVTGNPVKFALGNVSMFYDLIFMTQHYVLYRGADARGGETEALLRGPRDDEERRID
ncbi:PQ loop repeat-domain-containing protein [Lasiosphaeria miniovina]|uniref:PQ loop repeat-domain-containing protein n=1 Tax=Lasiosphaeria miniovina TaxID=1954250 RepID=A0AA40E8M1_9PEZI|nr:PQ loop repeat-domain-containing protein [Lasiosphaeria miniovina]KAK0728046.1 PQ loop repeat-domain-containing protein [Lasiosphaeria miniovina]